MKMLLLALVVGLPLVGCAHVKGMMGGEGSSSESGSTNGSNATAASSKNESHAESKSSAEQAKPVDPTYTQATEAEAKNGIYRHPPAGSPFSKLRIGMSSKQVTDLIGVPTDQKYYVTGKAWIPFYFGGDRSRLEYRYKGQGVVTFAGSGGFSSTYTVSRVIYNRREAGYER